MNLHERQLVEDTEPKVYIGRRIYRDRHGAEKLSPNWYAESFSGGKGRFSALRTKSKSVAIHRAHQFAEQLRANPHGSAASGRQNASLTELARLYMEMQLNRGRAPKTVEKYEYVLATFVAWGSEAAPAAAAGFTERHFWQWHKSLMDDGFSAKTRSDRAVIIKQLFKWAAKEKFIPANPIADARVPDPPPTPQPCFEPAQVAQLLETDDVMERAIFATMAYAGLRFGEVRDLTWACVEMPDDRAGHIIVRHGGSGQTTKNRKVRRIPLHADLRAILEALPRGPATDRIFGSPPSHRYPNGGNPLNECTWLKRLKNRCKACGFAKPDQYKLHTFRHVFASMCARNNFAHKYALTWMGHSSSDILDLYISMFDDVAEQAMKTIDYGRQSKPPPPKAAEQQQRPFMRIAR